jgi:hypothetical protein
MRIIEISVAAPPRLSSVGIWHHARLQCDSAHPILAHAAEVNSQSGAMCIGGRVES